MAGVQARCSICGEEGESTSCGDNQERAATLLENYVKCLEHHFQESNFGENEDIMMSTCDSCSYNLSSVINDVERMEGVEKEVSKLEKTLLNKLRELKTTGQRVLLSLERIGELMGDRKESNLLQKEICLLNVTEKASEGIRDELGNLEEKQAFVKKWTCGEVAERPLQITSVTSLANNRFEESSVFQVKTEPDDLKNGNAAPSTSDEPLLENVVKLEIVPVRKTRQGLITRTRSVSAQLEHVPPVDIPGDKEALEPELIELEDEDSEVLPAAPVASSSSSLHNMAPVSQNGNTMKRKRGTTEFKEMGKANEEKLEPSKKLRRILQRKTKNALVSKGSSDFPANSVNDSKFGKGKHGKWLSEIVSLLGSSQKRKELQNRLSSIPKLGPELFHELVVALKEANQLELLFGDRKTAKRGLHEVIERILVQERTLDILSEAGVDFNILDKDKRNVLHTAIQKHRGISLLKSLIKRGANVRQVDSYGENLIHFGISVGCYPKVLEFLISEGADVNGEDKSGTRPLSLLRHVTNVKCKFCLFKVLVTAGAELLGRTPLHEYLTSGIDKSGRHFRDLFKFIAYQHKIEWFSVENEWLETPLHLFLKKFKIDREALEKICNEEVDFAKVDKNGYGCLHYAIIGGNWNPEYLQRLVDKGADVIGVTKETETLLHFAVKHLAPLEAFQFLLEKGLDISAVQFTGYTALDVAIDYSKRLNSDVLSKLFIWTFESGVRHSNKWQLPMLHLAIEHGTPDVVEHMLREKDVNPNQPDQYGQIPLWKALGNSETSVEKAKLLIRYGANIRPGKDGKTVLHHAAISGTIEALNYCVEELRMNLNSGDKDGKTPLLSIMFDTFLSESQVEKAKILVINGADVNAKPNPNVFVDEVIKLQTSLHLALYDDRCHSSEFLEFVKLLLANGAKVNDLSLGGWTAMQIAMNSSSDASSKLIKLLKEFGAVE